MYVQRRLDTYITLRNVNPIIDDVNTIIAHAAINPPLIMYGSFVMPLVAKPSEDMRKLLATL